MRGSRAVRRAVSYLGPACRLTLPPGVRHVAAVVRLVRAVAELVERPTGRRAVVVGVRTGALVSPRVDRLLVVLGRLGRR